MDDDKWQCPQCGTENHGKFCIRCGSPKPQKVNLEKPNDSWQCSHCGQINQGKFCTKCGQPKDPNMISDAPTLFMPKATTRRTDKKKIESIVVAVAFLLFFAGGAYYYSSQHHTQNTQVAESEQVSDTETNSNKDMKTDLSLGGLDLGDAQSMIQQVEKGSPNDTKQEGSLTRYYYDDMQIVVTDGKISALVSNEDSVETKQGLHQGSTFADVKNAYGTDYQQFGLGDDITCYEYLFKTQDGKDGILRFAVKDSNHKVDYISVRLADNENAANDASAKQAEQTNQENVSVDVNGAQQALIDYHRAISSHNLSGAFAYLTSDQQERMGGYNAFQNGYVDTLSSRPSDIKVTSSSANQVVLEYNLTARDRMGNGRVKVQTFTGSATLVPVNGEWKISYTEASKTGETIQ